MEQAQTPDESSGLRLSYKTILSSLGAILVVVAGGTFALTKLSTSSHVAALQTELDGVKNRLEGKEAKVASLKASDFQSSSSFVPAVVLPDTTVAAAGDSDVKNLAVRILDLEKERTTLLAELAKRSQDALDPKSEFANLLAQLSSDSPDARMDAVRGLFDLADPRALNSLVAYFRANWSEATDAKIISEWFRFLFASDNKSGVGFLIQELQSDHIFYPEWAYEKLSDEPFSHELLRYAIAQLESVALRSDDTVVRTRAKLLLQRFRDRLEIPEVQPDPDPRGLKSLLKDIEAEVKKLTQKLDKAEQMNAPDSAKASPSEAP